MRLDQPGIDQWGLLVIMYHKEGFPGDVPSDEALIRCILSKKIKPFWDLRNYYTSPDVVDVVTGIEYKQLYVVSNMLSMIGTMQKEGMGDYFYFYLSFQGFIYDISSTFDSYAYLIKKIYDLKVKPIQVSFLNREFGRKLGGKSLDIAEMVSEECFQNFLNWIKMFRDNYIHRGSPSYVIRSKSHPTKGLYDVHYNISFLHDDAANYRGLIGKYRQPSVFTIYDTEDQIELSLNKLLPYALERTLSYSNRLSALILDGKEVSKELQNDPARLGRLTSQADEIERVFDEMLNKVAAQ